MRISLPHEVMNPPGQIAALKKDGMTPNDIGIPIASISIRICIKENSISLGYENAEKDPDTIAVFLLVRGPGYGLRSKCGYWH